MKKSYKPILIIAAVFLLAYFTNPDRTKHVSVISEQLVDGAKTKVHDYIKNTVFDKDQYQELEDSLAKKNLNTDKVISGVSMFAGGLVRIMVDGAVKVNNYGLFSVGRTQVGGYLSFGIFGHVFTLPFDKLFNRITGEGPKQRFFCEEPAYRYQNSNE